VSGRLQWSGLGLEPQGRNSFFEPAGLRTNLEARQVPLRKRLLLKLCPQRAIHTLPELFGKHVSRCPGVWTQEAGRKLDLAMQLAEGALDVRLRPRVVRLGEDGFGWVVLEASGEPCRGIQPVSPP
jgi:hypothetical protein